VDAGPARPPRGGARHPRAQRLRPEQVTGPGVAADWREGHGWSRVHEDHFLVKVNDAVTTALVVPGAAGEIVITTLTREAMPLIRYRTRDIGSTVTDRCACGRTTARMSAIAGAVPTSPTPAASGSSRRRWSPSCSPTRRSGGRRAAGRSQVAPGKARGSSISVANDSKSLADLETFCLGNGPGVGVTGRWGGVRRTRSRRRRPLADRGGIGRAVARLAAHRRAGGSRTICQTVPSVDGRVRRRVVSAGALGGAAGHALRTGRARRALAGQAPHAGLVDGARGRRGGSVAAASPRRRASWLARAARVVARAVGPRVASPLPRRAVHRDARASSLGAIRVPAPRVL
jgi:hypothetical protein